MKGAEDSASKAILVIEQEDTSRPGFTALMSGLRQNLATNVPGRCVVYTENLDCARFDSPKYRAELEKWFRAKYRGRSLDAIVAGGERSLDLTLRLREDLWPRVPVIFVGLSRDTATAFASRENLTGVTVQVDVEGSLSMALQLCPGTKTICFVGSEHGYRELYGEVVRKTENFARARDCEFIALTGLTMAQTKERLSGLSRGTIVLYLSLWMDAAGQVFNPRDALTELATISPVPIFGISDTHVGYGIVGGSCIRYAFLGSEVGNQVGAVLRGASAMGVPVVESQANQFLADWRELKRHELHAGRLPAGTEIRFRPPGLWELHRYKVLAVVGALVFQSVLIAALLVQRVRRRRAETSLRETEERMSLAIQAAGLGMWVWHANAEGPQLEPRCRRTCGFGTAHPMGRADGCTGPDSDVCPLLVQAIKTLSPASPTFEFECLHGKEEKKTCWIASRGRGYFSKEGRLQRLIGVSMDVTERKTAAQVLQEQKDQLTHVGRVSVMGQLASSLAHELNQPLGAILRNAEAAEIFLQKQPPDLEELRAILADIRKDDERAGAVIDRMRAMIRRRNAQPALLHVSGLISEVLSLVNADAVSRQVQLQSDVEKGLPAVEGDRVQLQQVLLNLLLNAFDAMETSSMTARRVTVRARRVATMVEVSVSDSGPGIPAECMARLFEPFFTTKKDGMGVGLPISRNIIEIHHGRIWAENNSDRGSCFRFTLPFATFSGSDNGDERAELSEAGKGLL